MSEIRLVRCPKCDKVLPEPPQYAVYQCGACGAVLRANRSKLNEGGSDGSEKLVNLDKEREGQEGKFNMAARSPARSGTGDVDGSKVSIGESDFIIDGGIANSSARSRNVSKSPMRERGSNDFDFDEVGRSPRRLRNASKSPMRDRFLNDVGSLPNSSRRSGTVSSSPMRERDSIDFDFDGVGPTAERLRNVSKSPLRGRSVRTPMSVRSRDVSRSPAREESTNADLDDVNKSPARSTNERLPMSPMRKDNVSEFVKNDQAEVLGTMGGYSSMEEEARGKMTPKASFNAWLPDDKHAGQEDDNNSGRARRTWRDQSGDRFDQISEGRESVCSDEHGMTPRGSVDNFIHGTGPGKEIIHQDLRCRGDHPGGYANLRPTVDQWATPREAVDLIPGKSRLVAEHGRISSSSDGPSYPLDSTYVYGDQRHSIENLRGPASIQDLEMERAALLLKYKELKEQLGSLDNRFSPSGLYSGPDDYSEDESLRIRQRSRQQFAMDKSMYRTKYGLIDNVENIYNFHPTLYDDPISGQMTKGHRHRQSHQLSKRLIPGYSPRHSLDIDHDPLELYHEKPHYHHPACSCSRCNVNDWQGQDLPNSSAVRLSANLAANPRSSHSLDFQRYVPRAYNPRLAQTTPQERPSRLAHDLPRRTLVTSLSRRRCHPISGGAPFVLCDKCFQLLQLPRLMMIIQKNQHKLQCGACSAVMSFDLQSQSFGLVSSQKTSDFVDATTGVDDLPKNSHPKHRRDSCIATSTKLGSYDFDAGAYSCRSMDSETSKVSKGQQLGTSFDDNTHPSPSLSRSSKDNCIADNGSVRSSLPNSAEIPSKMNLVRPLPGSPLQDHLDYSSQFHKIGSGEVTSCTGDERQVIQKDFSVESSVENTAIATETEVHSNEIPTTNLSQDSDDVSRKEVKSGDNIDIQSTATNFMRWGFASKPGHDSPGRAEVYVNSQSIQHRSVKKAEKLAGPILPGEYWYDPKAGFWGVMGHHCIGIIPPLIQEFSFPMQMNCSGGDTAVYVNGRELHKKDLDVLARRGLPTMRNRSYIIDLTGQVLDEDTKEFVANLGKLAPTVEKKRRGFGMQVPKDLED